MEELVLNGVTYLKASAAARNAGYTSDYVGQLCRSKKIDAKLVGRTWYVNPDQLGTHQVEKRRMSRVKAREQVRRSLAEHAEKGKKLEFHAANYESDDVALIPSVRKIIPAVDESREEKKFKEKGLPKGDEFSVLNKGNQVVMSGELDVVDADAENADDGSIVLSPKIMRTEKRDVEHVDSKTTKEARIVPITTEFPDDSVEVSEITKKSNTFNQQDFKFLDRLAQNGALSVDGELASDTDLLPMQVRDEHIRPLSVESREGFGTWSIIMVLLGALTLSFFEISTVSVMTYTNTIGVDSSIENTYSIDLSYIKKI